jgi:hypothetical protein
MRFNISLERQTAMLKDRQRVPDGVINLSGAVDHIIRRIECLKFRRFAFRSSMPLVVTRLVEDAALASEVQAPGIEDDQQICHDLEVRLADAIVQARLLQLTNEDHGFNCPQDALNRAFSSVYLGALRSQLCAVAYHIREERNSTLVADIDLSSCSVLSGPLAINAFVDDDLGEHTVSDEKTTRWINIRDILHRIEKNDDENQYDDEDWREWWDNNEPPFQKD